MDRGTVVRTIVLIIALLNQVLVSFGLYKIPFTEEQQTIFLTNSFTVLSALQSWFKNNYITVKGRSQHQKLKEHGLD